MNVSGPPNVATGWLLWKPRREVSILTVVAKVTYELQPGVARLAAQPEPIAENDAFVDGDPAKASRVPRDLVPAKPLVDVVLVGHAHSNGAPVSSLVASLRVGELTKSIEVHQERASGADGAIVAGPPFARMSIGYERAAGGPGTANPIGVCRDARDTAGRSILPNVTRPGAGAPEPIGLGPIAAAWPERRARLGPHAASFSMGDLAASPLPNDFDLGYFNAAPPDQQLHALADDERIVLQHLHPEYAVLETRLPGLKVVGRVTRQGRTQPLAMRADTLWIDADRGVATVTYRGSTPLEHDGEQVLVVIETHPDASAPRAEKRPSFLDGTAEIPLELRGFAEALPFAAPPPAPPPPRVAPVVPAPVIAKPSWADASEPLEPLRIEPAPRIVVDGRSSLGASNAAAGVVPFASEPRQASPVPTHEPRVAQDVSARQVLELAWTADDAASRVRRKPAFRELLDALENAPLDPEADDPAHAKDPALVEDRRDVFEVLVRAPFVGANELHDEYARCQRRDGRFVPSIVVVEGSLEIAFDEIAELEVTVALASAAASADEGVKSALAAAREFLAGPPPRPAAMALVLKSRFEEAIAQAKRPAGLLPLEPHRERALLDDRRYLTRKLFGGPHLRASLDPGAGEGGRGNGKVGPGELAVYLPAAAGAALPLLRRFRARLVVELRPQVDARDPSPPALRALAIGRLLARS